MEQLTDEVRKVCGLNGEFRLQYQYKDFGDALVNLTSTAELEDLTTIKVIPITDDCSQRFNVTVLEDAQSSSFHSDDTEILSSPSSSVSTRRPIVPPDTHLFCVACMGLAHAEAALSDGMSCENCADLLMRALKARRDEAHRRQRAAGEPPQPKGQGTGSASEKDWGSEHTRSKQENPMDLQDELLRILSMAVDELDLSWNAPDEPSKSKLDTWFLQSSRRQAASKRGTPFFPDVHDQVVKSWAAPQSARTLASTQAMFAPVDDAEVHGYLHMPPVEETVAAHLCPNSTPALGSDRTLPSKPCRFTAHQADKAYGAAGEAVSALHAMAILQVMQAKLLKSMDGAASADAGVIRDLRSATDLALVATKRAAQAVGRSMGYLVVLHRHLWLTLSDVKDADRKTLLNAPITSTGLFGDAVDKVTERYSETQKKAKAMSHVIPRRAPPPQPRSRSSSASRRPQAPARQPTTPRTDPDRRGGRTGQWQGTGKRGAARRNSPRRERGKPATNAAASKQSS
ncbi:unnamed protein product [Leuciscus chuanchicus]